MEALDLDPSVKQRMGEGNLEIICLTSDWYMLGFMDDFGRAVKSSIMVGGSRSQGGRSGNTIFFLFPRILLKIFVSFTPARISSYSTQNFRKFYSDTKCLSLYWPALVIKIKNFHNSKNF